MSHQARINIISFHSGGQTLILSCILTATLDCNTAYADPNLLWSWRPELEMKFLRQLNPLIGISFHQQHNITEDFVDSSTTLDCKNATLVLQMRLENNESQIILL